MKDANAWQTIDSQMQLDRQLKRYISAMNDSNIKIQATYSKIHWV